MKQVSFAKMALRNDRACFDLTAPPDEDMVAASSLV
jgi:hypothetical protein